MIDEPLLDPSYVHTTRDQKIAREGVALIKEQLTQYEWCAEPSDDATYRLYSRGNLRVRLTVPLETISFESVKSNRHLSLDIPVPSRKALYDLFMNYRPMPETRESRRETDSAEWLSCLHENRFGRTVWRDLP